MSVLLVASQPIKSQVFYKKGYSLRIWNQSSNFFKLELDLGQNMENIEEDLLIAPQIGLFDTPSIHTKNKRNMGVRTPRMGARSTRCHAVFILNAGGM